MKGFFTEVMLFVEVVHRLLLFYFVCCPCRNYFVHCTDKS